MINTNKNNEWSQDSAESESVPCTLGAGRAGGNFSNENHCAPVAGGKSFPANSSPPLFGDGRVPGIPPEEKGEFPDDYWAQIYVPPSPDDTFLLNPLPPTGNKVANGLIGNVAKYPHKIGKFMFKYKRQDALKHAGNNWLSNIKWDLRRCKVAEVINHHPKLDLTRNMADHVVHQLVVEYVKHLGYSQGFILDAGGNIKRNAENARQWIHTCNPHGPSFNEGTHKIGSWCRNKVAACLKNCWPHQGQIKPLAVVAVHSLYYMKRHEIESMLNTDTGVIVMVDHEFIGSRGSLDGELSYDVYSDNGRPMVKAQALGNNTSYIHPLEYPIPNGYNRLVLGFIGTQRISIIYNPHKVDASWFTQKIKEAKCFQLDTGGDFHMPSDKLKEYCEANPVDVPPPSYDFKDPSCQPRVNYVTLGRKDISKKMMWWSDVSRSDLEQDENGNWVNAPIRRVYIEGMVQCTEKEQCHIAGWYEVTKTSYRSSYDGLLSFGPHEPAPWVDDRYESLFKIASANVFRLVGESRLTKNQFITTIASYYKAFHQEHVGLFSDVVKIYQSKVFQNLITCHLINESRLIVQKMSHDVMAMYVDSGKPVEQYYNDMTWKKWWIRLKRKINPLSYLPWNRYKLTEPEITRQSLVELKNAITPVVRKPIMVATRMKYMPVSTLKPMPTVRETASVEVVTNNYLVKEPRMIDVMGVTIDLPNCIPNQNAADCAAATIMRMAGEHPLDYSIAEKYLTAAKNRIDELPEFEYDDPSDDVMYKYFCGQFGVKRAERLFRIYSYKKYGNPSIWRKIFVKLELYVGKYEETMKPRMIWCAEDWVIAMYSYWFAKVAKWIKSFMNHNTNVLWTSGPTPDQLWDFIAARMSKRKYHLEFDVSSWDGSVCHWDHEIEKYLMDKLIQSSNTNIDFAPLMKEWGKLKGVCTDRQGNQAFVKLDHGRASGDSWTSSFNSLLNVLKVMFVLNKTWTNDDFGLIVQGDDGAVSTDTEVDDNYVIDTYLKFGMNVEVVRRERACDFGFCSGWMVPVCDRYRWAPDPLRLLCKLGVNYNNHPKKKYPNLMYGIVKSLLPVAGHLPVVGEILWTLAEQFERDNVKAIKPRGENPFKICGGVPVRPDASSYKWFCDKYDVTQSYVFWCETWIRNNLKYQDLPCLIIDEKLRSMVIKQYGHELTHNPHLIKEDDPISKERWLIDHVPVIEESEKLIGCRNIFDAVKNGWEYGKLENNEYNISGHEWLHAFFSGVSYIHLDMGIKLHSYYNAQAIAINGVPCTRKNKVKKEVKKEVKAEVKKIVQPKKKKKKKNKPRNDSVAGDFERYGRRAGAFVGRLAANMFTRFTGVGDYTCNKNSIIAGNAPASMNGGRKGGGVRFHHSEYIADVLSSVAFDVTTYDLNPGMGDSFPWLNRIAVNFREVKWHGAVWTYRPLSGTAISGTSASLGAVVMATQYDASQDAFASKREMESTLFCTSSVPNEHMLHPIECSPQTSQVKSYYIRTGPTTDVRLTDIGKTSVATVGCKDTGSVLGELWLTYDIELFYPELDNGDAVDGTYWILNSTNYTNSFPVFNASETTEGNLNMSYNSSSFVFPAEAVGGEYLIVCYWKGSSTASLGATLSVSNATTRTIWANETVSNANPGTTTSTTYLVAQVVYITAEGATGTFSGVTLPTSGVGNTIIIARMGQLAATALAALKQQSIDHDLEHKYDSDDDYSDAKSWSDPTVQRLFQQYLQLPSEIRESLNSFTNL